jgi:hypothetical protein
MGKIVLVPSRVLRVLGAVTASLVVLSFALQVVKLRMPYLELNRMINFFDVDREQNLPTFYSALLLFVTSLLLALIATIKRQNREGLVAHWIGLAIGFLYISMDDMLVLHENLAIPVQNALRPHLPRFLYFAWVLPAGVLVLAVALVYLRFVLALPRRSRRLFVLSGAVYVLGALGMEMLSGAIYAANGESPNSLLYSLATSLEEGGEMGGVVLFIYALLDHLAICYGHVEIGLR